MSEKSAENLTVMLKNAQAGKRGSLDPLLPLVYDELKKSPLTSSRSNAPNHTLQATALVQEAYMRLIDQHSVDWRNRAHFFAIASEMMRRILVNHAEVHNAKETRSR